MSVIVVITFAGMKILTVRPSGAEERGVPSITDSELIREGIINGQGTPSVIAHRNARIFCWVLKLVLANETIV